MNWLTSYKQETKASEWKPSREKVLATLDRTGATGLGTDGNLKVVDQAFADSIRKAGYQFHVWTVNDIDAARTFASFKAFSITTDRPEYIRKAIQTRATGQR